MLVAIYAAGLIATLGLSAAYNLWPISHAKWLLRRFDHSAIYVLIAGTYTPFLAQLKIGLASTGLMIVVWLTALVGAGLKLLVPGRFDRLSIALYLLLGWSGVIVYRPIAAVLPSSTLWLLVIGGLLYSTGVALPSMAKAAFSERDLARIRGGGRLLPLRRGSRSGPSVSLAVPCRASNPQGAFPRLRKKRSHAPYPGR